MEAVIAAFIAAAASIACQLIIARSGAKENILAERVSHSFF